MKIMLDKMEMVSIFTDTIFLIVLASGVIGFLLFQESLKKEKVSQASIVGTSTMTIIPFIGGLLLGETISITEFIGIAMITLSAIILILRGS